MVRDEEICERLRGRWQRDQGRLTAGDISTERWAELCTEIDKVQPNLQISAAFAESAWAQGLTWNPERSLCFTVHRDRHVKHAGM